MTADNVDTVRDLAASALDQSGELMQTVSTHASETAANLGRSLIAYTKKNPIIALVLAVGAGALLVSATKSLQSRR